MSAILALVHSETLTIRRFELPDLDRHGAWLLQRLLKAYPHLHAHQLAGFLRGSLDSNECLFLYQDHSVAMFQAERGQSLSPRPLVRERFVWAKDSDNKEHLAEAANFYDSALRWAKGLGAEVIVIEEMTDVPSAAIKEKLGRTFTREQKFARV